MVNEDSGGRRAETVGYGTVSQSRFNKFMIQDSFIAYAEHFRSLVNYGQKRGRGAASHSLEAGNHFNSLFRCKRNLGRVTQTREKCK